jgi:uncharacterized protein (TIGR00106 family)
MVQSRGYCVIAEFSIHPIGEGTSVSGYVGAALEELKKAKGLRLQVTPMATVIEAGKLSDILPAVQAAHESLFRMGAKRVDFMLRVDDRRDKKRRMEDKVRAVTESQGTRRASATGWGRTGRAPSHPAGDPDGHARLGIRVKAER